jgi:hypothetical protein
MVACLVVQTAIAGTASAQTPRNGRIQGVVFDSVSMRALGGATVQLVSVTDPSRARATAADSTGRFRYDGVEVGPWILTARHPRLDSLGVQEIAAPVTVRARGATRATIAVPSLRVLAERVCGSSGPATDTSGYFLGTLRLARGGRASVRGAVRAQWLELVLEGGRWKRELASIDADTDANGHFVVCGVPVSGIIRLRAWSGVDSTGVVEFTLPSSGIARHDLYVGASRVERTAEAPPPATDSLTPTDSIITTVWRGDGRLRGVVRGGNGQSLANARVVVRASGVEARTDTAGAFVLSGLPTGTWTIDLRAIGFEPQVMPVDIFADGADDTRRYAMSRMLMLDTVKIRALRRQQMGSVMADFEERRRAGFGRFFGPDDLERIRPIRFTDLMRQTASVRLEPVGSTGTMITMRGFRGRCAPLVFVDRFRMPNDGTIDSFLPADWTRAVEIYQAGFAPPEFMDVFGGCGSIVVWTSVKIGTTGPSK